MNQKDGISMLSLSQIFGEVYNKNMWGGNPGEFYSGWGSDDNFTIPYCNLVKKFILENQITKVVDIGCGDFRVGSKLQLPGVSYVGIDVAPKLIAHNKTHFTGENLKFECLDATKDKLPSGDVVLIRQVLQHLANAEISLNSKQL